MMAVFGILLRRRAPFFLAGIAALGLGACSPAASSCAASEPGASGSTGCGESTSSAGRSGSAVAGGGSGGGAGASASGASAGASPLATFATVVQIVNVQCGGSGCHSGGQTPNLLGVDGSTLYSTLKSYVVAGCGNHPLVTPGAPEQSAFYLVQKGACSATVPQMPLGCVDNCTPANYLEGVRQWIANGAPQN